MNTVALLLLSAAMTGCVHAKDRRYVLVEVSRPAGVAPPYVARDKESGKALPCQWDDKTVRFLVPAIPAGAKPEFVIEAGEEKVPAMELKDDPGGWISVRGSGREITRYYHKGEAVQKHLKPFFHPMVGHGINIFRDWPVVGDGAKEPKDHVHHTGMWFAYGDVNGKDYWTKVPIEPRAILKREAGAAYARIVAENAWGTDLVETQDVTFLNAGEDVVVDVVITLAAPNGPAVFAKNPEKAKEGAFAVRVGASLSEVARKGEDYGAKFMSDAKGNKGEQAIRPADAVWVDYSGDVGGKKVGIALMNHPSNFRHPSAWMVRSYGLFAANPWLAKGESTIEKGKPLVLRYRVYLHAGTAAEGKVADVYEGFSGE